jgi:hypothetical protein
VGKELIALAVNLTSN